MTTYLGFSTYPIRRPTHGGQRRVAAFRDWLATQGVDYRVAAIYEAPVFGAHDVDAIDRPLGALKTEHDGIPLISDYLSGLYGAEDPATFAHFQQLVAELQPDAFVLEQPFLWPLVRRLRHEAGRDIPVIYSSHNIEAPLKYAMLRQWDVARDKARRVESDIAGIEREIAEAARLIIACSAADVAAFGKLAPGRTVRLARNGVSRPTPFDPGCEPLSVFGDKRFLMFVGSAYPPNIEGVCDLILDGGLFFVPPEKRFAICGGCCDGAFNDTRYQAFLGANAERCHFFPKISDGDLSGLKAKAHGIMLPIAFGGGTNLKTAEAIASGKHVVATTFALRGFEEYHGIAGLRMTDGREAFRAAMIDAMHAPPLVVPKDEIELRDRVYWDRCFDAIKPGDLPR